MAGKTTTEAANYLRAWRERAGLKQVELAKLIDTKPSTISELESGEMRLSDKWLFKLADALKTRAGFILEFHPDDVDGQLLDAMLNVGDDDKEQALTILRSFKRRA